MNLSEDVDLEDYVSRPEKVEPLHRPPPLPAPGSAPPPRPALQLCLLLTHAITWSRGQVSGAEIHCIVQEAGMQAVRNNRYVVLPADFEKGYKANTVENDKVFAFYR